MIAITTLARVDTERLQRGVEGLASGAYSITVTHFTKDEISAQVSNGDGKSYPVTLTAVALSLYVIRTPETKWATEMPAPDLSLAKVRRHEESAPF
jgi:hypothetical protein